MLHSTYLGGGVLATAVDDWSGKPFCVSSWYELTPTYNNALATTGTARENRKKADPTSFLKHLKTLPRSAPYSNPSSSFHILGLSSEGPRSSEKLIIAFRLSIQKSKTHHRCIVDRLKRPPKILQTFR